MSETLEGNLELQKASLAAFITEKISEFQATGSGTQELVDLNGYLSELNGSCSRQRMQEINDHALEISRRLGNADSAM